MDTFLTPKNAEKFHCENCDFNCSKQSEWNRHTLTLKHQQSYKGVTNDTNLMPKNAKNFECDCGNTYKFRQGLYKHKKLCYIYQETISKYDNINNLENNNDNNNDDNKNKMNNFTEIKEFILTLVKENQDVQLQMQKNFIEGKILI